MWTGSMISDPQAKSISMTDNDIQTPVVYGALKEILRFYPLSGIGMNGNVCYDKAKIRKKL